MAAVTCEIKGNKTVGLATTVVPHDGILAGCSCVYLEDVRLHIPVVDVFSNRRLGSLRHVADSTGGNCMVDRGYLCCMATGAFHENAAHSATDGTYVWIVAGDAIQTAVPPRNHFIVLFVVLDETTTCCDQVIRIAVMTLPAQTGMCIN